MKRIWGDDKTYRNDGHALWQFANEINPGDIVFAKRGLSAVIGRGVVESGYIYDPSRAEYKHIHKVRWTNKGEWEHPGQAAMKTLTDITPYTEYVQKLEALFADENDVLSVDESATKYPDYSEQNFLNDVYMSAERYSTLKGLLLRKKNIILQGTPGVGKTFAAQRLAFSIMGEKDCKPGEGCPVSPKL
jgi:5-methylcytosine-specific restriction protein B